MTKCNSEHVAALNARFPKESLLQGHYQVLQDAGFKWHEQHGGIEEEFCRYSKGRDGNPYYLVAPEGFCVLGNGLVGFKGYYGETWLAPGEYQEGGAS